MKFKRFISILIVVILMMPQTAYAWKSKSHNYIANLILEEIEANRQGTGSTLNIAPFGKFAVDPEFLKALTEYPEAFRAGAQGPDAYPDIYVGQSTIHPGDGKSSGEWLRIMLREALKLPENSPERYKIMSFTLGFMCHYSGDLFGHNYINDIAGGPFPSVADLANPSKAKNALHTILFHISSESYMDNKIPAEYMTGEKVKLAAPLDFVLNVFIFKGNRNNGFTNNYVAGDAPEHFEYMATLRDHLYKYADGIRSYSGILSFIPNAVTTKYLDAWIDDIDKGIYAYIQASENIARKTIGNENALTAVKDELSAWVSGPGKYMTPVPDIIVDLLGAPKEFLQFLKDKLGLAFLYDLYNKFTDKIQKMITNYIIYDLAGLSEEQVQYVQQAMQAPQQILGPTVIAKMDKQMKNFGNARTADEQEFLPFYNSLIMTKLILIGPDGMQKLVQKAAGNAILYTQYKRSNALTFVDNLKVTIHTRKNGWFEAFGTDDDIYFGVKLKDGRTVERLLDKSGYNDFESNDVDTYDFPLNQSVKPSEIKQIWLRKKSIVDDDWTPNYVDVSGYTGSVKCFDGARVAGLPEIIDNQTYTVDVSYPDSSYTTALNTGIIDFLQSLDGSLQWENTNFQLWSNPVLQGKVFGAVFKDVATLKSIAITTPAKKLVYIVGEKLDITGMVVTVTYSDGSKKIRPITDANVKGFNSSAPAAKQKLTVNVGGKTVTFTVTIKATSKKN